VRIGIISPRAVSLREVSRDIAQVAQYLGHTPRLMDYYADAWTLSRLLDRAIIVMAMIPVAFPPYALLNRDLLKQGVRSFIYTTVEGEPTRHTVQDWWKRDVVIVANSWYTRKKLEDAGLNVHAVVHHGVNMKAVEVAQQLVKGARRQMEYFLGPGVYFLTVASDHPRKGLDLYANVIAKVVKECKTCKFYIFTVPNAKKYFAGLDNVYVDTRYGKLTKTEILALYGAADWYVQPSLAEGFCLPVLEAMAMGTPAIHVAYHPITEYSDPEANIWVPYTDVDYLDTGEGLRYEIHKYNPDDMASAIIKAADEKKDAPEDHMKRREKVRKTASKYDIAEQYAKLITLLETV